MPIKLIGGICYDVRDDFPNVAPIGDGSTPRYGESVNMSSIHCTFYKTEIDKLFLYIYCI